MNHRVRTMPLAGIALITDASTLTSIANDYALTGNGGGKIGPLLSS